MNEQLLDKKTDIELEKHKQNVYLKSIIYRKSFKVSDEFTIEQSTGLEIKPFLLPIQKFSSFAGSYYFSGTDPLVNTALELINNKNITITDSYLYNYYKQFQPKTYGDLYGLTQQNRIHKIASTSLFHPWVHSRPTNVFRAGLFGPKDISNVQHRIYRLQNLIQNITNYGYKPIIDDMI